MAFSRDHYPEEHSLCSRALRRNMVPSASMHAVAGSPSALGTPVLSVS